MLVEYERLGALVLGFACDAMIDPPAVWRRLESLVQDISSWYSPVIQGAANASSSLALRVRCHCNGSQSQRCEPAFTAEDPPATSGDSLFRSQRYLYLRTLCLPFVTETLTAFRTCQI